MKTTRLGFDSIKIGQFATIKSNINPAISNLIVCRVYHPDTTECKFVCISNPEKTWTHKKSSYMTDNFNLIPLPAGTIITLTVNLEK